MVLVSGPALIPGTDLTLRGSCHGVACPGFIFQDQARRGGLSRGCPEAGVRVTVLDLKFMAVVGHKPLPVLFLVQQGSEGAYWKGRRRSRVSVLPLGTENEAEGHHWRSGTLQGLLGS